MDKVKVTVVMNFYNEEKYLSQAIESILNQTYQDFELLLVDDASTDNSNEIANSYTDSRIRIIRNQTNQGLAYGRNVGMREARGEYVAFADADDYSAANRIELEVKCLENCKSVLAVSCWSNYIDEDGKLMEHEPSILLDTHEVKASFLFGNPFSNPGSMIRRDVYEKYGIFQEKELRVSQDYFFWLQVLEVGELKILPEKLLFYRVHNSKASQDAKKNKKQYDELMEKLVNFAWKSYGFDMEEKDIGFIYNYFFKQTPIWKISDLVYMCRVWKKICNQLSCFSIKDRNAVKKIFANQFERILLYLHPIKYIGGRVLRICGWNSL